MRWLGLGMAIAGAGVALASLLRHGSGAQLGLGLVTLGLGAAVALADWALSRYLQRLGLRSRHLAALQGALRAGDDRGRAAIDRLRRAGLDGTARVLTVAETGSSFSRRAEVDLELEVSVEGRAPYTLRQRHLVPAPALARLREGALLKVKIDPELSDRVLIDWPA